MVIRLAFQDGEGAIELLDENQAYHLVAEGHGRERYFGVGTVVNLLREAVRSAHDEDQPLGSRCYLFFKAFCKLYGCKLLAVLVQKDDLVAGLQLL